MLRWLLEENESFSIWLSCFAVFVFISISFLFFRSLYVRMNMLSNNEPMATSPKESAKHMEQVSRAPPVAKSVKKFRRSPENVHRICENAGERTTSLQTE